MERKAHFNAELFRFLKELRENNRRDWFLANRERYLSAVRDPFLQFIADLSFPLYSISPYFVADPSPNGGSLFRISRETRFSADKTPYKTHAGAHFPHSKAGKDVHASGFYLHLEPGGCFAAAGVWHPDLPTATRIRDAIVARPKDWEKVRRSRLEIEGESLSRAPRGYDPGHARAGRFPLP